VMAAHPRFNHEVAGRSCWFSSRRYAVCGHIEMKDSRSISAICVMSRTTSAKAGSQKRAHVSQSNIVSRARAVIAAATAVEALVQLAERA